MESDILEWARKGESFIQVGNATHAKYISERTLRVRDRSQYESKRGNVLAFDEWFHFLLSMSRAVVAGSFPLSIIMGSNFANDIDIFHNSVATETYLEQHMFRRTPGVKNTLAWKNYMSHNNNFIDSVNEYSTPQDVKFQVIRYDEIVPNRNYELQRNCYSYSTPSVLIPPANIIKDMFDLDICKVIFDGRTLEIPHMESIINRRATFMKLEPISSNKIKRTTQIYNLHKYVERSKKYADRGFLITNQSMIDHYHQNLEYYISLQEEEEEEKKKEADREEMISLMMDEEL